MSVSVLTLATQVTDRVQTFIDIAESLGYNVFICGRNASFPNKILGQPWIWRTRLYIASIKRMLSKNLIESDGILICCDSNDVLFLDSSENLSPKINKIFSQKAKKLRVLVGTERLCCNGVQDFFFQAIHKRRIRKITGNKTAPFPNAGCIIGFPSDLITLFEMNTNSSDDQSGLHHLLLKDPDLFYCDFDADVIENITSAKEVRRNSKPCVVHFPGMNATSNSDRLLLFNQIVQEWKSKSLLKNTRPYFILEGKEAESYQCKTLSSWSKFMISSSIFIICVVILILMVCLL